MGFEGRLDSASGWIPTRVGGGVFGGVEGREVVEGGEAVELVGCGEEGVGGLFVAGHCGGVWRYIGSR